MTTTPEVICGDYYERGVVLIRPRSPILHAAAATHLARSALVDMSGVTRITTDGSWAQVGTATDHLTGTLNVTCAAAVVLQKDDVFVSAIRVKCDGAVHRSAYSTEVVGLALAAQLSSDTEILSDCQAALKMCHRSSHGKRMNSPLSQVLSSGIHNRAHNMRWVKAHPERSKPIQQFTLDDRSIYAADLLAGGRMSEFMAFTGLSADKIAETSDVAVLADYSNLAMITVVDDSGRPVLEPTRVREKRLMLEEYQRGRTRPQFVHGTPLFGAAIRQPARTLKLSYNGQRSRAQWVRIMWDKHFTGSAQLRYGAAGSSGHCKCCLGDQIESQAHIIRHCTGGSMPALRDAATRTMSAYVTKLTREAHPRAAILAAIREMILGDDGAELWTGMLTPLTRERLDHLTRHVPAGPETAQLNALIHNLCRPLATGVSDMYTERSRILAELAAPRAADQPPSTPTIPTDFDAIRRLAAAAVAKKKKQASDKRAARQPPPVRHPRPAPTRRTLTLHRWFRRSVLNDDDDDDKFICTNTNQNGQKSCIFVYGESNDATNDVTNVIDAVDVVGDVISLSTDDCTNTATNNDEDVIGGRHTKKRGRAHSSQAIATDTAPARRRRLADARRLIELDGVRPLETYFTSTIPAQAAQLRRREKDDNIDDLASFS